MPIEQIHMQRYLEDYFNLAGSSIKISWFCFLWQVHLPCKCNIFIYLKVSCQLHGVVLRRPPQKEQQKQPKQHSVPHKPTRAPHSQLLSSPPVNTSEPHYKQSSRLNQKLPYLFRIPLNRFGDVIYIVTPVALNGSLGESAEYATRFDDSNGML